MSGRFKVLFLYPNLMLANLLPAGVSILSACLKKRGYETKCFDTTYYRTSEKSWDEIKLENLQIKPFNLKDKGIELNTTNIYGDLLELVGDFKADLVGLSAVESTYELGISLTRKIKEKYDIPIVAGGVYPTFSPELTISEESIDMVCIGEGEETIVELCDNLRGNKSIDNIRNLWIKKEDGAIIKNPLHRLVNLDKIPNPDFSIFEKRRIYRPMQGKMYAMLPIETARGCPYTCTYCADPALNRLYNKETNERYFRKKSVDTIISEIKKYIKIWNVDYTYFSTETFLAMTDEEFDKFTEHYEKIRLPFWIQTRAETITEDKIKRLEEINCHWMSVGIEHGNEEFRKKILKRRTTNEEIFKAFKILEKYKIGITVNNLIGFPFETRDLVFDTINLNRQIKASTYNAYTFTPFRGCELHEISVKEGFMEDMPYVSSNLEDVSLLNMPQLTKEDIKGLIRTFNLYVKMPESEYDKIRIAEKFDEKGNRMFRELSKIFFEKYFN